MGLDFVEIVMDVEKTFGIRFRSDEFGSIQTVGDFISLIRLRIVAADNVACPSLSQFLQLRSLVREVASKPDLRIRPSEQLQSSLSSHEIRRLWQLMQERFGIYPATLQLPCFLWYAGLLIILTILIGSVWYSMAIDSFLLPLAIFASAFITIFLIVMSAQFRSVPPKGWATFGDVTRQLSGTVVASRNLHLRSDELILEKIRPIFSDILNVNPNEIVPSARLIEDLRVN
jgi:hypothetical protein